MRVSASSIKALKQCSLAFYYSRMLRMPERKWSRTIVGSLVHSLFECLARPRHLDAFALITAPGTSVDYTLSPKVARLVRWWQIKHSITDELIADLNGMLYVGLLLVDFHFAAAQKVYPPEYGFTLVLDDGSEIRGYIDRMAEQDGVMVIRDYKSQRNRFTANEMADSIQAIVYQLAIWQQFKMPARVEFVMLRHPPTKRTPLKHLQVIQPATEQQLAGLEEYIKHVHQQVNQFTMEEALAAPCADEGFCSFVCSYLKPFTYLAVVKRDDPTNAPLRTYALDAEREPLHDDERLIELRHGGCAVRHR